MTIYRKTILPEKKLEIFVNILPNLKIIKFFKVISRSDKEMLTVKNVGMICTEPQQTLWSTLVFP